MQNKYDISIRERKSYNKIVNSKGSAQTTHNIYEKKELEKWLKKNNSKKGGKSRHYN
tara:strand:+ start:3707 stop:3877 length:171 start_codon:yes stop_codon:yes gene_type:complete